MIPARTGGGRGGGGGGGGGPQAASGHSAPSISDQLGVRSQRDDTETHVKQVRRGGRDGRRRRRLAALADALGLPVANHLVERSRTAP